MKVIIISEENHGFIGVAASMTAAKRFLLASNWINAGIHVWVNDRLNEKGDHYFNLKEAYGENWEKVCMGFDTDALNELGFYFREEKVYEEEN